LDVGTAMTIEVRARLEKAIERYADERCPFSEVVFAIEAYVEFRVAEAIKAQWTRAWKDLGKGTAKR
jgi:hypothetical protein